MRKDARTARKWELALPEELSPERRKKLAVEFARELAARYGCGVDVAIHDPGKQGDRRNHHAHLLATTRTIEGHEPGAKTAIELSDAKRLSLGLEQGRQEIEEVCELWAKRTNEALEEHGKAKRIDHRSLAAQLTEALTAGT
jgi:ATP-dependent exoDNAse (exonuclease V) alpha subunit